jgi:hypothetical protein
MSLSCGEALCHRHFAEGESAGLQKACHTYPSLYSLDQLLARHANLGILGHDIGGKVENAFENVGIHVFVIVLVQPRFQDVEYPVRREGRQKRRSEEKGGKGGLYVPQFDGLLLSFYPIF